MRAAKDWYRTAAVRDRLAVAAYDFEYGDVLDDLADEGVAVPASSDVDFSWGFFKQVKGKVFHALREQVEPAEAPIKYSEQKPLLPSLHLFKSEPAEPNKYAPTPTRIPLPL